MFLCLNFDFIGKGRDDYSRKQEQKITKKISLKTR